MDSQSLDSCIQKTLSSLYHPFESTAATVLCQVLDVVEKTYRGDGLSYLIDFLIPVKRILQSLQQDACLQYCGLLFRHAGWPLCIHDKIVLQLASIDWRLLQPGDFYLQVVPYLRKTPRIVLKCLAEDQHNIEEVVLPEVSYTSIFTVEWLEFINSERIGASLENCLLTCDDQLYRVPWDMIVHPEFVEIKPSTEESAEIFDKFPYESKEGPTRHPVEKLMVQDEEAGLEALSTSHGHTTVSTLYAKSDCSSEIEGEYVELRDITVPRFGPQKGSLTQSIALNFKNQHQRAKSNQTFNISSSNKCTESSFHSYLQPETIMGASSTHYDTDHVQKPESIGLVDIEFGVRESSIPDCTHLNFDNGAKSFQQAFSLENEAMLEDAKNNVIKESDNSRQLHEPPDNYSTSLSFQGESRSHSRDFTEDGRGVTDASQEPVTEHSRTHGSPVVADKDCCNQELSKTCASHPNTEVGDQKGPQLLDSDLLPEIGDRVEGADNRNSVEGADNGDSVEGADNGDSVEGADNGDSVEGADNGDSVEGAGYGDSVEGAGYGDSVEGAGYGDSVEGAGYGDSVEGAGYGDSVEGAGYGDSVEGAGYGDSVEGAGYGDSVEGAGYGDSVEGAGYGDSVEGAGYGDSVEGAGYGDSVEGAGYGDSVEGAENGEGEENRSNVEIAENMHNARGLSSEVIEQHELPVARDEAQFGYFNDQTVLVVSDVGQGLVPATDACAEQPVHSIEQTKLELPYCQESPPRSPQYTKHAQSPATQLPLETLHEDTEEEQGATTGPPEVPGRDIILHNVSVKGQTNGQERTPEICLERDPSPLRPHGLSSPSVCRKSQSRPWQVRDVNVEVLTSGVIYLPGTRDRSGRALVIINTRDTCWLNPHCNAAELGRLLLYFYSVVRRDCRALGLTLLVDTRRCSPVPALFKAIHIVQSTIPHCIHGVLLLTEKDLVLSVERPQGVQFDVLTSVKSLHKHIEASQLPPTFNGTFLYCHQDWLSFRTKLENLQDSCRDACIFLHNAIQNMQVTALPNTAGEASLQLTRFGQLMTAVLEDARLVTLQTEGGAVLARLRKEESCVTLTDNYRETVDMAAELYNRVDEGVHSLVRLSNQRIQEMELVIGFEAFEERFHEVSGWIENVGERVLEECSVLEDSLEVLLQTQGHFREFDGVACEYCKRGQELLQTVDRWQNLPSPDIQKYMIRLQKCQEKVGDFSRRLEECRSRLEKTVRLYQFFDKAYEWALDGMRHLGAISLDDCNSPELCVGAFESLEKYQLQHPMIGENKFEEMRELAYELKNEKGIKHWKFAWSKCQEAKQVFEKKLEAALRAKSLVSGEQNSVWSPASKRLDLKVHSDRNINVSYMQNKPLHSPVCGRERRLGRVLSHRPEADPTVFRASPPGSSASSIASSSAYRMRKLSLQSSPSEDLHLELVHQVPSGGSTPTPSRPMGRRLLRKAQSFDLPGTDVSSHCSQRRLSEPARRGNTGVFIKGLEVSSTELAERSCSPRLPLSLDWSAERMPSDRRSSVSSADGRCRSSKLRHIIDEMVTTEREYVRSLWYISENYFPEMDRIDLPQDLRGKRGIIFGNLEKLRDFHSQYFLKELESCCNHPLRVSHCFLRHKDQFGMYALYSKNKPRSDLLLASHGNIFFKNKQRQLGDKMDLASYLLKPIQRMIKYALLLKDLIKECGEAQEQELAYLRAAEEMVKFQLRHGNDLLAMDAIRDCDVNLKEQGQLVRQDEFTVWLGRKKCQRHVFLFEDLILFSKPKRIEGGLDVYIYKRSFKTADIGLTENSGDSGQRFEIWFRRRKSNDTHILQASSAEIKQAWTTDIAKILWQQATRNKEVRMQEMVSMGVGNKPFLDIKPSDAAINNRAIDYIMKGRGARTRASIAVSLFDHLDPYKRTQAPITCNSVPSACGPSSASLLGPLNLHMYVNQTFLPGVLSPTRSFETSGCLEEDELENETSCSQPSMTTESSESSHCMSGAGSSGSDSGCVSSIPQDNLSEDAGSPCDASAQYTFPERRNSSGVTSPVVEKSRFINRQYISAV
ncbi:rho guanine nucleotide exchange factor 40-like isoform X2 [Bufo bufo]|uniref:rho guanine nucleotide exchange factor 40-like isoform X2 n=1 Tax=Bufo bufo TaxID=8384 RepID=UPI001ABE5273|nr:rho guanine nucleotide exchange factor 40-like isoform X2 [Bufo bufo]